jgi:hypothetical protein
MMRHLTTAIALAALLVASAGPASARSTVPSSRSLASGSAAVGSCGSLGAAVPNFTVTGGMVTSVQLGNVPATCNGASLTMAVTSGSTALASGGPVTVASGTASVPITPSVATGAFNGIRLGIVGP